MEPVSDEPHDDRRARDEFDRIFRENLERAAPTWRTWRPPPPDADPEPWWRPVLLLLAVVAVLAVLVLLSG